MDDKIKKDLEETMNYDGSLQMNMSKFYIKNNKVISHPSEINKKVIFFLIKFFFYFPFCRKSLIIMCKGWLKARIKGSIRGLLLQEN